MGKPIQEIFTGEALSALIAANEHAARRGSELIEPDHLFLGMIDPPGGEPDERVHSLLTTLGGEPTALAIALATHLGPADTAAAAERSGRLDLEFKQAIERATHEATALAAPQVDTSHLFLGLLCSPDNHASTLLAGAGVTVEAAREAVQALPPRYTPPPTRLPLVQAIRPSPIFLGLLGIIAAAGAALASDPGPTLVRPITIAFIICSWIVAVCVHEFGHCLAAFLGGDAGVVERGGLTLGHCQGNLSASHAAGCAILGE